MLFPIFCKIFIVCIFVEYLLDYLQMAISRKWLRSNICLDICLFQLLCFVLFRSNMYVMIIWASIFANDSCYVHIAADRSVLWVRLICIKTFLDWVTNNINVLGKFLRSFAFVVFHFLFVKCHQLPKMSHLFLNTWSCKGLLIPTIFCTGGCKYWQKWLLGKSLV